MQIFNEIKWWKRYFLLLFKIKYGYPLANPRVVWIDIINECNLRCLMCPQSKGFKKEKKIMEMNEFQRIIDQISICTTAVNLYLSGEPLLNKNLFEMIKYAKHRGCIVRIHTNATLLNREMSETILKSSLDYISFSFDGCNQESYEKIRIGANFMKVKSQIEIFLKLKQEMGVKKPYTMIEIIRMKETQEFISSFIRYWKYKGVDRVNVRECITWHGLVDDHRVRIPRNCGHKPCLDIFLTTSILTDGTVVPCCMDVEGKLPLGNILEQPFGEIWNGKLYNHLRKYHIKNTIPENIICHECYLTWIKTRKDLIRRWISQTLVHIDNAVI